MEELKGVNEIIKQLTPLEVKQVEKRGDLFYKHLLGQYKHSFTWEEKIDFILRHAVKAVKKEDIIARIKTLEKEIKRTDIEIIDAVSPVLSTMCKSNKVRRYKMEGERGFYYVHSYFFMGNEVLKMVTKEMKLITEE